MHANLLKSIMWVARSLCLLLLLSLRCIGTQTAKSAVPTSAPLVIAPTSSLITLDTTRADRMGFLGSKLGLTPNLDALARQSVVFTRAYAQVPLTTPSHAALLTGTYPQYNQLRDLGQRLRADLPYVPDLLHQNGYHTAAFVGAMILDPVSGACPPDSTGASTSTTHHFTIPRQGRIDITVWSVVRKTLPIKPWHG